jgi:hypothetical protein
MLVPDRLTVKMTVIFCGAASGALQINSLGGSLMIEWVGGRGSPPGLSPASSVGRLASRDIGKGRGAAEARYEVLGSISIVSFCPVGGW